VNWVLDTNIISYLLRGDSRVRDAFVAVRDAPDTSFILSPVVDYEIRRYLLLKGASRNLAQYEALTATWTAVPLSEADWRQAAALWADRHRNGTPIEDADLLIAVTALAREAVLVTHNTRHFGGLDLRIADWTLENDQTPG
jgi:tRNA(fMet)-specific endonuclease VapC